jgi:hypothetical protein
LPPFLEDISLKASTQHLMLSCEAIRKSKLPRSFSSLRVRSWGIEAWKALQARNNNFKRDRVQKTQPPILKTRKGGCEKSGAMTAWNQG